jgi:tetratricopeptide (TPR) repeat protein
MSNLKLFLREVIHAASNPMHCLGSLLDALRGWRYSRKRIRIVLGLIPIVFLGIVFSCYGFSLFERVDSRVQRYGHKSEDVLSTSSLEESAYSRFEFLKQSSVTDSPKPAEITPYQMRFVKILNERILLTEPEDNTAKYRLALTHAIGGNEDECSSIMTDIASGENGPYPAAHAWIAARMIDKYNASNDRLVLQELGGYLKTATNWPGIRPEMLAFYARILASSGMLGDAITVAKQAVKRSRFYNLDLMQYYSAAGNSDGLRTSGNEVEKVYGSRINTALETKLDRLAVAEARFLMGKPDAAIEILKAGLEKNSVANREELLRALSEYRLRMFDKSIQRMDDGTFLADTSLLDEAVDADPSNPRISEVVARMLPMKIQITRKVVAVLKQQIELGITTGEAHRTLAEGYYASGNVAEAIKSWEQAVKKNPNDVTSMNNLALVLARESPSNLERAFELVNQASLLSANSAELLDTHGQILAIANKPAEAIAKLEAAVRLEPDRINTRKVLEQCYRKLKMNELADSQAAAIEGLESLKPQSKNAAPPK